MIIINIYHSKETDFSHNGLCVLDPIVIQSTITQEINGSFVLDLEVSKDIFDKYKFITEFCIIKTEGQLFRLYNLSNTQDTGFSIRATLHHISNDLNADFLDEVELNDVAAYDALNAIVLDSRFTITSDISTTTNFSFIKDKPLNAIFKTLIPAYDAELYRDNFIIGLKNRIGVDTGVSIEYAKNITGFEQTLDYSGIVTRMMPTGKDGATIEMSTGGSKWIESSRISQYFKPFSSEMQFPDLEDASEIQAAGESLWGVIDLPKANYRVNFIELKDTVEYKKLYKNMEYLKLGDGVTIRHKVFEVDLYARVIKITKDGLTGKTLEIELGEFRDNLFKTLNSIDYKIASSNSRFEETKQTLYTKVNQTNERLTLEAIRIDGNISDTRSMITMSADDIRLEVSSNISTLDGRIDSAFSAIQMTSDSIGLKVSKNNVVSEINLSPESIKIAASKLELSGYTTFTSLSNRGGSIIDGGNIITNTLLFSDLAGKPDIPTIALDKIKNTYINGEGVWTSKVYADNIQAGTLKSVNLESSSMKLTGGTFTFDPFDKFHASLSFVRQIFNTYDNLNVTSTGEFKYWANSFWFDKTVHVSNLATDGYVNCSSLTVNGTSITGNAVVAKFG